MISYIKGELAAVYEDLIIIENAGIGYNIRVPASVIASIPPVGEELKIYTYLYVREDAINLYGFLTRDDLSIFKLLINVSGIGPKGALGILSVVSADELRFAVLSEDVKLIKSAPGIGAKTAQRLIIELKDKLKIEDMISQVNGENINQEQNKDVTEKKMLARNEAVEALTALGYSRSEALSAIKKASISDDFDSEAIIKAALKELSFL